MLDVNAMADVICIKPIGRVGMSGIKVGKQRKKGEKINHRLVPQIFF